MYECILIGTANPGKFTEFKILFRGLPHRLISLKDVGINNPVEETGNTFVENAVIKAEYYSKLSGYPTVADDSGLEVDILDGEPGVRSARYAGEDVTDHQKVEFLLRRLKRFKRPWVARFRCVIAISYFKMETQTCDGICEGEVIPSSYGENGFGYDPIFYLPRYHKTMAQLSPHEKNLVSHRGVAASKAQDLILKCSKMFRE